MKVRSDNIQLHIDELAERRNVVKAYRVRSTPKTEIIKLKEEFNLAFEKAKDPIFWADIKTGIIINCNKAATSLLEKNKDEIIGFSQSILHPQQKSKYYIKMFEKHISKKVPFEEDAEVITKSGKIKPVHIAAFVSILDGKPIIQGIFRDITERKKAEQALMKSEANYRQIFEMVNDAIFVHDIKSGAILDVNQKTCTVLGYSVEELRKLRVEDFSRGTSPYSCKEAMQWINKASAGDPQLFEWHCKKKGGHLFWVEVNLKRAVFGGKKYVLAVVRDITDRKKSEYELRESEKRLLSAQRVARMGFLTWDLKTDDIYWSDEIFDLYGVDQQKVKPTLDLTLRLIHPEDLKFVQKSIDMALKGLSRYDIDHRIISPDGSVVYVHAQAELIRDANGSPDIFLGTVIDITDRKKAEKKTELLNKQLRLTNRKLERLALRDPHTQLYNHRYFAETIAKEFHRAKRYAEPFSLIMLDIDYFKSVNDVYGHKFGDFVLVQFAKKLRKLVHLHDHVIRFGDEEFVILLPQADRKKALDVAHKILDFMRVFKFGHSDKTVKLRLSSAVISYPEDNILKDTDFIELAEKVLAKAKKCGGDRVCSSIDLNSDKETDLDKQMKVADVCSLKHELEKNVKHTSQSLIESIFAFAKMIELKDQYTGDHVESTVNFAILIARKLKLCKEDELLVKQASMLHDLGKIGISEKILQRRGPLTKKEFEKIKEHPRIAIEIIRPVQFLRGLIPLIFYHHERWDGKGYPSGLKGNEIPIGARIIAIADVYHALISDRPYRKAFSVEAAIEIIRKGSGTQFDPKITDVFLRVVR